jgi:hypothetical protein
MMKKLVRSIINRSTWSFTPFLALGLFLTACIGLSLFTPGEATAQRRERYYRLQLKQGGQYLDADHCSTKVALNPGSDYAGGACQLWRLVPAGDGWSRLQLKQNGQYLDADHCTTKVGLNPGSDFDGGACQLWRFVAVADGWSRLQLKQSGYYLDADHCSTKVALNPGSDYAGGACQLWRLVPVN